MATDKIGAETKPILKTIEKGGHDALETIGKGTKIATDTIGKETKLILKTIEKGGHDALDSIEKGTIGIIAPVLAPILGGGAKPQPQPQQPKPASPSNPGSTSPDYTIPLSIAAVVVAVLFAS